MAISYTTGDPSSGGIPALLEKGRYRFKVVNATQTTAKSSGNPMIELESRRLNPDGTEGRKVYDNLVFTEKALWRVDQFLAASGIHPGQGQEIDIDPDNLIGLEYEADIIIGKDNKGRDRNEVEAYVVPDESDGGF